MGPAVIERADLIDGHVYELVGRLPAPALWVEVRGKFLIWREGKPTGRLSDTGDGLEYGRGGLSEEPYVGDGHDAVAPIRDLGTLTDACTGWDSSAQRWLDMTFREDT